MKIFLRDAFTADEKWLASCLAEELSSWRVADMQLGQHSARRLRIVDGVDSFDRSIPAGFCFSEDCLDERHLLMLYIEPQWRRRGLAKRLMADLVESSRRAAVRVLLLEVRAANDAALALYVAQGFGIDSVRKNYYPPRAGTALGEASTSHRVAAQGGILARDLARDDAVLMSLVL